VALLERVRGRPVEVRHGPPRAGDVRDSLAALERARDALGYAVEVGVEEGLRRTWEWWVREGAARHLPAGSVAAG
jgi:nucleoside-diphosphate-sugar epimerase